jgi:hypothetical protein
MAHSKKVSLRGAERRGNLTIKEEGVKVRDKIIRA